MYLQIKYCFEHEYNLDKDKLGALSFHVSLNPPLPSGRWCQAPLSVRDRWSPLSWRDLADPHP